MKVRGLLLCWVLVAAAAVGETLNCNLQRYKSVEGLKAEANAQAATLTWSGESGQQLRAQFTIRDGQPIVQELAARAAGGQWVVLGKDLLPDFQVTTGRRRISHTQLELIKQQGVDTPEQEKIRKWNTFWDAPLEVPGGGDTTDLPRNEDEIRRGSVSYKSDTCAVVSDGARESISFNGLSLGLFSGTLQFTVYKASNLLRQEAIAKTDEDSVAFIYKAGLKGCRITRRALLRVPLWSQTPPILQRSSIERSPPTFSSQSSEPANTFRENR